MKPVQGEPGQEELELPTVMQQALMRMVQVNRR
ncbi:MAG: hypothetical protein K0S39_6029, partial [Paenibacillus sp.]|nr:hypothetical protein [Paenibacillus sp.]